MPGAIRPLAGAARPTRLANAFRSIAIENACRSFGLANRGSQVGNTR